MLLREELLGSFLHHLQEVVVDRDETVEPFDVLVQLKDPVVVEVNALLLVFDVHVQLLSLAVVVSLPLLVRVPFDVRNPTVDEILKLTLYVPVVELEATGDVVSESCLGRLSHSYLLGAGGEEPPSPYDVLKSQMDTGRPARRGWTGHQYQQATTDED